MRKWPQIRSVDGKMAQRCKKEGTSDTRRVMVVHAYPTGLHCTTWSNRRKIFCHAHKANGVEKQFWHALYSRHWRVREARYIHPRPNLDTCLSQAVLQYINHLKSNNKYCIKVPSVSFNLNRCKEHQYRRKCVWVFISNCMSCSTELKEYKPLSNCPNAYGQACMSFDLHLCKRF